MTKLHIILRGEHGGELDRKVIRFHSEQEESLMIRQALANLMTDGGWILNRGDTITIEAP